MKPPICCVCGHRDDPAFSLGSFADRQALPSGMSGHPVGSEGFCSKHVRSAQALTRLQSDDAIAQVRTKGTLRSAIRKERRRHGSLYVTASVVFALLVFLAFARRYYLAAFFHSAALPVLLHLHGAVMSGWVMLFAVQCGLVAVHRVQWHRRLGILSAAWAALVVTMGTVTTILASAREVRGHTDMAPFQLTITGLELVQMLLFAGFVASAVWMRHRSDYHKRLMLLTIACMLPSIIPRLPFDPFESVFSILLAVDVLVAVCIGIDVFQQGRLHPALGRGGIVFLASMQIAFVGTSTRTWQDFLTRLLDA